MYYVAKLIYEYMQEWYSREKVLTVVQRPAIHIER